MKKHIITIVLIAMFNCGYAQLTSADLNSGKHFTGSVSKTINGLWHYHNAHDILQITIVRSNKTVKRGNLNATFDCLSLTVKTYLYHGKNIEGEFMNAIELYVSNDPRIFKGVYRDPVTKNNVYVQLVQMNDTSFKFSTELPEMDVTNTIKNGTILPKTAYFAK